MFTGDAIVEAFKAANNLPLGAALSFVLLYVTFALLALRSWLAGREEARV